MGKNRYLLFFMGGFFILYFFLFPFKVKEEFILVPREKIILDQVYETGREALSELSLESRDYIGYLDEEYRLTRLLEKKGRTAVSDYYYVRDEGDGPLLLGNKRTTHELMLDTPLSPLLFEDRIFLADLYTGYLKEIDSSGNMRWEYFFPSLITCFDSRGDYTLVGLLNGEIFLFDRSGNLVLSWAAGGSRIDVVYGVALSPDGNSMAVVSGLDPQRFIFLEKKENGFRPVFHENLDHTFHREVSMDFSHPDRLVLEGASQGLNYFRETQDLVPFEIVGDYRASQYSEEDGTILLVSGTEADGTLLVYTEDGETVFHGSHGGRPLDLDWEGHSLLLTGEDNLILMERGFY